MVESQEPRRQWSDTELRLARRFLLDGNQAAIEGVAFILRDAIDELLELRAKQGQQQTSVLFRQQTLLPLATTTPVLPRNLYLECSVWHTRLAEVKDGLVFRCPSCSKGGNRQFHHWSWQQLDAIRDNIGLFTQQGEQGGQSG